MISKLIKSLRPLGVVALLSLFATGASFAQDLNKPITIGVVLSQSGPYAGYGGALDEALKIFDKAQSKGATSPFGRRLEFKIFNDNSDASQATAAVRQLVADPEVVGLICCNATALMLASYPILQNAGIPTIFHTPTHYPNYNETPYIYSITAGTWTEESKIVSALAAHLGIERSDVAYVLNNDASGQTGTKEVTLEGYTQTFNLPATLTDYGPFISQLREKGIKMIMSESLAGSSVHLLRAQLASRWDVPVVLGQSSVGQALFDTLGTELKGIYLISFPAFVTTPELVEPRAFGEAIGGLRAAYEEHGGNMARIGLGGMIWTSLLSFADAGAKASALTREGLNEYMETQEFAGVNGLVERRPDEHKGLIGGGSLLFTYEDGEMKVLPGILK